MTNSWKNTYGDAFVGYDDFTNGTLIAQELKNLDIKGNVVLLHGDKSSGIEKDHRRRKIHTGSAGCRDRDGAVLPELGVRKQRWAMRRTRLRNKNNDIAAFVCMNDGIASGTIQALKRLAWMASGSYRYGL